MADATAGGKVFTWWFWPNDTFQASDEFVMTADCFRIRLMGSIVELSYEGSGNPTPTSARELADKYAAILAKHLLVPVTLITNEEFATRTEPPFGYHNPALSRRYRNSDETAKAVRDARNEMLSSADKTLRECYDHMQDAFIALRASHSQTAAYAVYKAIEVLEDSFGGEHKATGVIGDILKKAKTAANQERHIAKKVQNQPKTSDHPVGLTQQVIRNYENHLLKIHRCTD